jgi:hypothetical protein
MSYVIYPYPLPSLYTLYNLYPLFIPSIPSIPSIGVDMVRLNDEGRIEEFIVLARPPNAVAELKVEMMSRVPSRLAALKAKQAFSSIFG